MTLKSDSHYLTLTLKTATEKNSPLDLDNVISALGWFESNPKGPHKECLFHGLLYYKLGI